METNQEGLKEKDGCCSDAEKKEEEKSEKKGLVDIEGDKRGALYNVLLAVSHKNKHTGYCQVISLYKNIINII